MLIYHGTQTNDKGVTSNCGFWEQEERKRMREEIEKRRAEAAEKKKQKEEESTKPSFTISPKGSSKVSLDVLKTF